MYVCTNCGAEQEELYRRYCPSVLKLLKCGKCGELADKYVEYDRAIILVDLILIEKQAYRHLLCNSEVTCYWKIIIVLWLVEAIQRFSNCDLEVQKATGVNRIFHTGPMKTFSGDAKYFVTVVCGIYGAFFDFSPPPLITENSN